MVKAEVMPVHDTCVLAMESAAWSVGIFMPTLLTAPVRSAAPPVPEKPALSISDWVDAGVLASWGTTPAMAFGFSAHLGRRWSHFSLAGGVHLEFSLPDGTDTFHVSASRMLVEAVPCLQWKLGRAAAFGCGVVQAGVLMARVQAPEYFSTPNVPSVSAGVRVGAQIPFPRLLPPGLEPYFAVDLIGALLRATIFADDSVHPRLSWQGSPITGAFTLGLAYEP
jgi:hypothetical protein